MYEGSVRAQKVKSEQRSSAKSEEKKVNRGNLGLKRTLTLPTPQNSQANGQQWLMKR